jgi:hypothetical protein
MGGIMRYPLHRLPIAYTVLAGTFATVVAALVLLEHTTPSAAATCLSKQISVGQDLDAIVNADPAGTCTTFLLAGGTYTLNQPLTPDSGDKIVGAIGTTRTIRTAFGDVTFANDVLAKITDGSNNLTYLIRPTGNVTLRWLDVSGADGRCRSSDGQIERGTGVAIRMGEASHSSVLEYLKLHNNEATGVSSMRGEIRNSQGFSNSTLSCSWGHTSAFVKGVDEFEAHHNFVHDEQGVGIWCDHMCADAGAAMPYGFWAHHNIVVKSGRSGIRYEFAPIVSSGVHSSQPTALIENNEVHQNGLRDAAGGISIHDAQNARTRNNNLGAATLGGVSYTTNASSRGVLHTDSGRSDRTDLWNADTVSNTLNGDRLIGCELPDNVVDCTNDTSAPLAAPSNLSAVRGGSPTNPYIDLSWRDNSTSEARFVIERSTTRSFSNPVTYRTPANTTRYRDDALQRKTTYYYRVFAVDSTGTRSAPSNVASATTK